MASFSSPELNKVIEKTPLPIRTYLQTDGLEAASKRIAAKTGLGEEARLMLVRELFLVLTGFSDSEEFAATLAQNASVPQDKLSLVLSVTNEEIFVPLQKMLSSEEQRATLEPDVSPSKETPPLNPSAPAVPPKSANYSVDPYREPIT